MKTALFVVLSLSMFVLPATTQQPSSRNPSCAGEADVVFVVDASSTTTQADFASSLNFIRGDTGFAQRMELKTSVYFHSQVGIVLNKVVGGQVDVRLGNFTDSAVLSDYILQVVATHYDNQPTNLTATVALAANQFLTSNGGREEIPQVIVIVVSDVAIVRSDAASLRSLTYSLLRQGIVIMAAVYGNSQDPNAVNSIVSAIVSYPDSQYKFYFIDAKMTSSADGQNQREAATNKLCTEIPICTTVADIAFLLDSSANLWPEDWTKVISFVERVVEHMYVAPNGARIALMTFGENQTLVFNLMRYDHRDDVLQVLKNVTFNQYKAIDISSAINFASTNIFSSAGGSRVFAATHMLILISTGFSNINADKTNGSALAVQNRGIFMLGISVGPDNPTLTREMQTLSSKPTENFYFSVSSFDNLQLIDTAIINRACRPIPARCNSTIDLAFVVDTSGSIPDSAFQNVKGMLIRLIERLGVDDDLARVALLAFSDVPHSSANFSHSTSNYIENKVREMPYSGGTTNTAGALQYVRQVIFDPQNGARPTVAVPIVMLITDGNADNQSEATRQAQLLRNMGVGMIAIGVGNDIDVMDLQTMASYPSSLNTILVTDYDQLSSFIDPLINIMCSGTTNCDSNPCRNGATCLERLNSFYCDCVGNFTGVTCSSVCNNYYADVIFALDSSGSIAAAQYQQAQDFIRQLVLGLNVDDGTRVGALAFSNNATIQFLLNAYNTTEQTLNAINFRYLGQETNMAEAFRVACQSMFTPEYGDRPNAPNILILITDGQSTSWPPSLTLQTALDCRGKGIQISAVVIGDSVDMNELSEYVTEPAAANIFPAQDFTDLAAQVSRVLPSLCNVVDECASSPCNSGSSCVDGINRFTCLCPAGYIGVRCNISCLSYADVVFVVDYAASVRWEVRPNITNFLKNAVTEVSVNNDIMRVAFMYFTDRPYVLLNLSATTKLTDLLFAAYTGSAPIGGPSNLTAAFVAVKGMFNAQGGDRPYATNIAVVVIDRVPSVDLNGTTAQAIGAHTQGIYTILLTVGEGMNSGRQFIQLQALASDPVGINFLNVWNYSSLPRIAPEVATKMCNQKDDCLSQPCQNNGICIDGINQYVCNCGNSYSGNNCERACTVSLDVVFICDESGSLELGGYDIQVDLMNKIVDGLNFESGRTRMAFVTFARNTMVQFYLNTFTGANAKADILNAMRISDVYDGTDIALALRTVRTDVLTRGRRPDVQAVCILLSDGRANYEADMVATEAGQLQNSCTVYAISIQEDPQQDVMDTIATSPAQLYTFMVPYRSNVTDVSNGVLDQLCLMNRDQ